MFASILAEKLRGSRLTFLSKMLSGETLCKLPQIFPPKVLVYIWKNFSWHLFDYWKSLKEIIEYTWIVYWITYFKNENKD